MPKAAAASGLSSYPAIIAARRNELVSRCAGVFMGSDCNVLEVGSGHGHFLAAYAQHFPNRRCVGIDLSSERVERAVRKRDRARLPNLHFFRAEMGLFLECVPVEVRWNHIFVLFPDPWPKSRHHKHRLIQSGALAQLARTAAPACRLYLRTDFLPYFEAAAAVIAQSDHWDVISEPWPFEYETVFQRRAAAHVSLIARRRA